jgi:hypothetical protein
LVIVIGIERAIALELSSSDIDEAAMPIRTNGDVTVRVTDDELEPGSGSRKSAPSTFH